jgi:hypothetical protein
MRRRRFGHSFVLRRWGSRYSLLLKRWGSGHGFLVRNKQGLRLLSGRRAPGHSLFPGKDDLATAFS